MGESALSAAGVRDAARPPRPRDILELTKPHTWFPPMWAFTCGVVSSGASLIDNWIFLLAGIILTGPIVCGTSQVINDWCDRHVDAINEPDRPIPSGRVGGRWGVWIALAGVVMSLLVGAALGPWVFAATCVALFFGWAYSAPPLRLKRSGWIGPAACALSYEGLAWFTGAAVMLGGLPGIGIIAVLLLYSLGTHGIMTLNDFKAVDGDRQTGLRSLPVVLGVRGAALTACAVMALSQVAVVALLARSDHLWSAAIVALLLVVQGLLMMRFLRDPRGLSEWYNRTGVVFFVLGMMAAALGLGGYL